MVNKKTYWIASREYAGIAEAGGVKSVVTSLAIGMQKNNWDVTVFIPLYGCTAISCVEDFDIIENITSEIIVGEASYKVVFAQGYFNNIRIVFIVHTCFTSKMGVYTYTKLEEALSSSIKRGEGHKDASIISILFQKSIIEYGLKSNKFPDVFHCQDAHTSLIPFLVNINKNSKRFYKNTKFFITIHNAGTIYRNQCGSTKIASELLHVDEKLLSSNAINGKPEPFLLSQNYATITTVSPWYAKELLDDSNEFSSDISKEFLKRKFSIIGITNGIDLSHYDPTNTDTSKLPFSYNPAQDDLRGKYECRKYFLKKYHKIHKCNEEKKLDRIFQYGILSEGNIDKDVDLVYFSFHGRIVHQKGIDVLTEAADIVLSARKNARFIVIGQGEESLEKQNYLLSEKYYGKYIFFQGYDKSLSRLCIAMSDFLVLPSFFEPCGLEDFIGQIYGTIPIANACGGLNKIIHERTGFLYHNNDAPTLAKVLIELIDRKINEKDYFDSIISYSANYIKNEYSWDNIIKQKYIPLFS